MKANQKLNPYGTPVPVNESRHTILPLISLRETGLKKDAKPGFKTSPCAK